MQPFKFRLFRIGFAVLSLLGGILLYQRIQKADYPSCKDCNVILISVDTLRPDHMGVYGYEKNTTPNIDKWAKDAIVFTRAYTIFPETYQSFFTLFTGSNKIQTSSYPIPNDTDVTLPTILNKKGFKTAAFVTNPVIGEFFPLFKRGFDTFGYSNKSPDRKSALTSFKYDAENAKEVTQYAQKWLQSNKGSKFFLWVHYSTPHMPYNPSRKYLCNFDSNCNNIVYEKLLLENSPYSTVLKNCTDAGVPQDIINKSVNLYDSEIYSVDGQIGNLLNTIKNENLDKRSLVVFYTDHGEGFDHNIFGHSLSVYESSIRLAFIIKYPNIEANKVTRKIDNTRMSTLIMNLLDVNKQNSPLSDNLLTKNNITDDNVVKNDDYIFSRSPEDVTNKFSIFTGKYKYIFSSSNKCLNDNKNEELYDLTVDPNENTNILNKNKATANKLRKILFDRYKIGDSNEDNHLKSQEVINKLRSLGY